MTRPTAPIELLGHEARLAAPASLPEGFLELLATDCPTVTAIDATADASRDWWPLSMHWALNGQVLQRAAVVASPTTTEQVAAVMRRCNEARVPVTPAGGRSGVVGASVCVRRRAA